MATFFDSIVNGLQASVLKQVTALDTALGLSTAGVTSSENSKYFSAVQRNRNTGAVMVIGFIPPEIPLNGTSITTARRPTVDPIFSPTVWGSAVKGQLIAAESNVAGLPDDFYLQLRTDALRLRISAQDYLALIIAKSGADLTAASPDNASRGFTQFTEADLTKSGSKVAFSDISIQDPANALAINSEVLENQLGGNKPQTAGELFLRASGKTGTINSGDTLFSDPNPGARTFDSKYQDVRPDGRRPLKQGEPGYDASTASQQEALDRNSSMINWSKPNLSVVDVENFMNRVKSTRAYQLAVSNYDRVIANQSTSKLGFNLSDPGIGVAKIVGGTNATDTVKTVVDAQGGNTQVIDNQAFANATMMRTQLAAQYKRIAEVPPLALLVNPTTFRKKYEHTVDYTKGRRRPITSMWIEKPVTLDVSGSTAAQYAFADDRNGGLTSSNRIYSLSYENLMSLVWIYKNNGHAFFSSTQTSTSNNIPFVPMSIYIYYDGRIYIGSFDSFSVTDSADKPYNLDYNFAFTVRYEIPTYS